MPTPGTPFSTAGMFSKHISTSANTSNPLFNCPHALKKNHIQCEHLKPPFQLPKCPENTFHAVTKPQTPFYTAPMRSKHISPSANHQYQQIGLTTGYAVALASLARLLSFLCVGLVSVPFSTSGYNTGSCGHFGAKLCSLSGVEILPLVGMKIAVCCCGAQDHKPVLKSHHIQPVFPTAPLWSFSHASQIS